MYSQLKVNNNGKIDGVIVHFTSRQEYDGFLVLAQPARQIALYFYKTKSIDCSIDKYIKTIERNFKESKDEKGNTVFSSFVPWTEFALTTEAVYDLLGCCFLIMQARIIEQEEVPDDKTSDAQRP